MYVPTHPRAVYIDKPITLRARYPGAAVIDGENARQGVFIHTGTVLIHGLNITRGYTQNFGVRACYTG